MGMSDEMVPIGPLYAMPDLEIRREGSLDPVFIAYSASRTSTFNMPGAGSTCAFLDATPSDVLSLIVRPDENAYINVKDFRRQSTELTQELTSEKINKLLCNNPNCPGVKKFKELGLGPLATEKGHGAVYEPLDIPLNYGLSHAYGVLENYGPYGVFRKPKNLKEPIEKLSKGSNASCTCKAHSQNNSIRKEHCSPLRLNGGSPLGMEKELFPAPMAACKDLMEDFDKLLSAFKQAMGPCGQATCPFSGNIVQEQCKKLCRGVADLAEGSPFTPTTTTTTKQDGKKMSACGIPTCPYGREAYMPAEENFKRGQIKNACGSPVCPYSKKKLGLDDDDIDLIGTCGSPKCKLKLLPDPPPLEPIHWDCPDPLPKGPCKNPECPLQSKELACFKVLKGPCGSEKCPYAPPPWCGAPSCPFGSPKPCPFAAPPEPEESNELCGNPDCPYAQKEENDICENPNCPFAKTKPAECNNDNCPFKQNVPSNDDICDNPECPYALPKSVLCENPECPYPPKTQEICENPDCPYAAEKKPSPCYVPNTPSICSNPNCPHATVSQKPSPCYVPVDENEICGSPYCPMAANSVPPCPYPASCPYNPPPCPFLQSSNDVICTDPFCPYIVPICRFYPCPIVPNECMMQPPPMICPKPVDTCTPETCKRNSEDKQNSGSEVEVKDSEPTEYKRDSIISDGCRDGTCKAGTGNIECDECGMGSQSSPLLGESKQKGVKRGSQSEKAIGKKGKGRRKRGKYVYSIGDKYPGVQLGHKECLMPGFRIPPNMGWLWNVFTPCLSLKVQYH